MTTTQTAPDLSKFEFWLRHPPRKTHRGRAERPKSDNTVYSWTYTVRRFLSFLDDRAVDEEVAGEFVQDLEGSGNSPRSVGRHLDALRAYYRFLGMELDIGNPRFERKLPRWLREEEWDRLLGTAEAPLYNPSASDLARGRALQDRAALMVYCGAGLRLTEGCRLEVENVDPRGYLRVMSKGGHEDIVPVEDPVITAVQDLLASRRTESAYVFPGLTPDRPMARRTMQRIIKRLMLAAGINDAGVHSLRHTAGAHLRKAGTDIRDIQDLLRHSSITSTQIYTQMAREDLRRRLPRRFMPRQQLRLKESE